MTKIFVDKHRDIYATTRKGREVICFNKAVVERFQRRYFKDKPSVIVMCLTIYGKLDYRLVVGRVEE